MAEFDLSYSNRVANGLDDRARTDVALLSVSGKRLTYNQTN
jgi:hypothetical protein